MRPRSRCVWLTGLSVLLAASGCEEPRHVNHPGSSPQVSAPAPEPAPVPTPAPAPVSHGEILGKRTQDIKEAQPELQKGAQVASQKIVAKDPITLPGNAYVSMIGKISIDQIDYAMKLYQAENGRYPKDYQEFMEEIIKKNNIALPVLPHYQEYGYDAANHKLIILEYPDRKANPPKF
jgi:hypothetical protein